MVEYDILAENELSSLLELYKQLNPQENIIDEFSAKNIWKNIVENAIKYAKEQNCYKVILQSGDKRTDAHGFYESLGFDGDSKRAFEIRFK
jgi:GNAT superfamily N-acetyltransferase